MTDKHASEDARTDLPIRAPTDQSGLASQSPTDELVAGMVRTMKELHRDPLLHHRLSQRGF